MKKTALKLFASFGSAALVLVIGLNLVSTQQPQLEVSKLPVASSEKEELQDTNAELEGVNVIELEGENTNNSNSESENSNSSSDDSGDITTETLSEFNGDDWSLDELSDEALGIR